MEESDLIEDERCEVEPDWIIEDSQNAVKDVEDRVSESSIHEAYVDVARPFFSSLFWKYLLILQLIG